MDQSLKVQLEKIADKLEKFLFPEDIPQTNEQTEYFQSFFTESYVFPQHLLKYFRQELTLGLFFNTMLSCIFIAYLPFNFGYCWECNKVLTLWLTVLGAINAALFIPKILLVRKLIKIEQTPDIYLVNYHLWMFFRSQVYKFNIMMSKYVLFSYIAGGILLILSWANDESCDRFYGLIGLLLGSFVVRVLSSFFKFIHSFNNPQNTESLFDYFNGSSTTEIQSLAVMTHKKYCEEHKRIDEMCPICYENYNDEEEVKIMECPGYHAFHKKCIDKWLVKSLKCPKCNLNIFHTRAGEKQ